MVLGLCFAVMLMTSAPAMALTLGGTESLADNVLGGSGGESIKSNQADQITYKWGDKNGDNGNIPVSAGFDMAGFNLTRITDIIGFRLDLGIGGTPGAITNGGTITTSWNTGANKITGSIDITNVTSINVATITTEQQSIANPSGKSGSIQISGAKDIVATNLITGSRNSSVRQSGTGNITVQQTGSFLSTNVHSVIESVVLFPSGNISFTGGGVTAGSFNMGSGVVQTRSVRAGNITIDSYKGVTIGSAGMVCLDAHLNATAAISGPVNPGNITVMNIGADGVAIAGDLATWDNMGSTGAAVGGNGYVTVINVTAAVTLGNIDTHSRTWGSAVTSTPSVVSLK